MNTSATKHYMEILRAQYGGCSDYRISQLLKVSRQCVSRWSQGKGQMDDEPAAILADLCDLDAIEVLTDIHIERSRSRVTRKYYEDIKERLKGVQGAVAVMVLGFLSYPSAAHILF